MSTQTSQQPSIGITVGKNLLVNVARLILASTFIFSGFVKAIDPLGVQYKIQDYIAAVTDAYNTGFIHDWGTLVAAVLLAAFEFVLGINLLFAISRRITTKIVWLFMLVMTCVTVWIFIANPVSDCGCFGEAVVLTNGETLLKNIVLLALATVLVWKPLKMLRLISEHNAWIVSNFSALFILAMSVYCLYKLPIIDFRPYHIGANIAKGMEIPEGAEQPQFDTKLIYEKNGEKKEFTMENIPDSTWTFVDSESTQISEGYVPPIHDFSILYNEEDITEDILSDSSYTFLLIAPHLETADQSQFGNINIIADYAKRRGYRFLCLTASSQEAIEHWTDITGAEYEFANTDETTLKTIVRSSPGLLLIKEGDILQKWSHNILPKLDEKSPVLEKTEYGTANTSFSSNVISKILLWYVLPLLILTLFDRIVAAIVAVVKRVLKRKKNQKEETPAPSSQEVETNENDEQENNINH